MLKIIVSRQRTQYQEEAMAARVCLLDENYAIKSIIGNVTDEAIFEIIDIAKVLNLNCLSFIYVAGDSYFNIKGACVIKKEVTLLRNYPGLNQKEALDIIEKGVEEVLKHSHYYLEFLGD